MVHEIHTICVWRYNQVQSQVSVPTVQSAIFPEDVKYIVVSQQATEAVAYPGIFFGGGG